MVAIIGYDLAAYKRDVTNYPVSFCIEGSICSREALRFVCMCMTLQERFKRSKFGVTKREPGEAITGLDLFHFDCKAVTSQRLKPVLSDAA